MSYENIPKNLTEKAVLTRGGKPDYTKLAVDAFPTPTADEAGAIIEDSDTGDRWRWTGAIWAPIVQQGASIVYTQDFLTQVANGDVAGHRLEGFQMQGNITGVNGDIWAGPGDMVHPTAAESYELVCANVNDTAAGTGMRSVVVVSLDANRLRQTQVVATNGGTVAVPGTHRDPHLIVGGDSCSSHTNEGDITLQVAGGGAVRNVMLAGVGISHDGHFTIPSNETAQFLNLFLLAPKNTDAIIFTEIGDGTNANYTWISSAEVFVYESMVNFEVFARLPLASESLVRVRGRVSAGNSDMTLIYEMLFVEV